MSSTARGGPIEPSCLFPDEAEIAQFVIGPKRAKVWARLALERSSLPHVDVMFGGRYWHQRRREVPHEGTMRVQ